MHDLIDNLTISGALPVPSKRPEVLGDLCLAFDELVRGRNVSANFQECGVLLAHFQAKKLFPEAVAALSHALSQLTLA